MTDTESPYDRNLGPWWPFTCGAPTETPEGHHIRRVGCHCTKAAAEARLAGETFECRTCCGRGWVIAVARQDRHDPKKGTNRIRKARGMAAAITGLLAGM